MAFYQLDCSLREAYEEQGWLYMTEILDMPGCRAWAETASAARSELCIVAEQFILSYRERGDPMPASIVQSTNRQGRVSVAV